MQLALDLKTSRQASLPELSLLGWSLLVGVLSALTAQVAIKFIPRGPSTITRHVEREVRRHQQLACTARGPGPSPALRLERTGGHAQQVLPPPRCPGAPCVHGSIDTLLLRCWRCSELVATG